MRLSHNLEIVDEDELVHDYDEEVQFNDAFAPNSDDEEMEVEINKDEVQLGGELQVVADDDTDYVGSEDELDNFSDTEYEHNNDIVDFDWTTVLPSENLFDKVNNSDVDDDSDVLLTPPASEDDEEHEKFPAYKSGEVFKFQLGMMFNNKDMVRDALKEYAMKMNKNVSLKKNDGKRMVVKCMDGCKFYMRITKRIGNQFWQFVSLIDEHTCYRTAHNRQAKTTWLAKKFAHILRHNPDMKPVGLIAEAVDRWGVKLSHDKAYRAKRRAMELIQGAGMDQFTHLRRYAQELLKSNPNSNVVLQCADSSEGPVFERIYVCLEACKSGFSKYCRPLIGLDACFLKGDYGGQLMAAVGRDGNKKIYPIAYAVVEAETKDSWEWFINILMEDLESLNHRAYAFISDQQKGLVPAVQSVSAHVEQRLCVKHLYGNWKKKYPGLELKEIMWSATRATTVAAWERAMLRMKSLNKDAWKEMKDISAQYWSRSHFKTYSKCDLQRITSQKDALSKYNGDICPRIQLVLEKNKKVTENWTPTWHGDDDLAIFGVTNGSETYVVNLKQETCACRKWDLTGIPCCHAITCILQNNKKPEEYVSGYYRKTTFKETYSHIIFPTNGPQVWPHDDQVSINPPVMRRAIGRSKKMRNKINDEPRNPHVLPRKLPTVTCHKCGAMGHNMRTCKGKRAADRAIPKGGNNKKAKCGKTKKKSTSTNASEVGNSSQAPQPTQPSQP
ncbi:uncharacterized protein LOC131651009 [Vicia villosa]|uniref:uncharacterized protein LOC131651009 n=1 Tax=Vicia villosa TaxID=3911 RepID=UPI00273BEC9A|nr:uncharacterized protein LOC131651009 [Vicia villosa]